MAIIQMLVTQQKEQARKKARARLVVDDVGRDGELRRYAPSTWVYTDTRQKFFEKATAVGFSDLTPYSCTRKWEFPSAIMDG
eukprot:1153873-Pelagomonas_calceolata.AAC.5